jgi:hypothetical protein
MGSRVIRALGEPERGLLAQPAQRAGLAAAITPPIQRRLQLLAVLGDAQDLDATAAVGGGTQTHQVELARDAHPRRAVQRAIRLLAPPQANVQLARVDPTLVRRVEARERGVAMPGSHVGSCSTHPTSPLSEGGLVEKTPASA